MPRLPPDRLARLLRDLSPRERARFVAAVWSARGWETSVEGVDDEAVVIATRGDPGETLRIQVVVGRRRGFGGGPAPRDDVDVVVAIGVSPTVDPGIRLLDMGDLRDMALYGVDRSDLDDVFRSFFGRPVDAFHRTGDSSWPSRLGRAVTAPSPRSIVAGILLVAILVAAGTSAFVGDTAGPSGAANATTGTGSARTFSPAPTVAFETATADSAGIPTAVCPPPPTDLHPRDIRPIIVDGLNPEILEGWSFVEVQNGSAPAGTTLTPRVVSYIANYVSPEGVRFRVHIRRWASAEDAYRGGDPLHSSLYTRMVWGRYSIAVEPAGGVGPDRDILAIRTDTRKILAAVRAPGQSVLGWRCSGRLTTE